MEMLNHNKQSIWHKQIVYAVAYCYCISSSTGKLCSRSLDLNMLRPDLPSDTQTYERYEVKLKTLTGAFNRT